MSGKLAERCGGALGAADVRARPAAAWRLDGSTGALYVDAAWRLENWNDYGERQWFGALQAVCGWAKDDGGHAYGPRLTAEHQLATAGRG